VTDFEKINWQNLKNAICEPRVITIMPGYVVTINEGRTKIMLVNTQNMSLITLAQHSQRHAKDRIADGSIMIFYDDEESKSNQGGLIVYFVTKRYEEEHQVKKAEEKQPSAKPSKEGQALQQSTQSWYINRVTVSARDIQRIIKLNGVIPESKSAVIEALQAKDDALKVKDDKIKTMEEQIKELKEENLRLK
jgi:hypothetical protein